MSNSNVILSRQFHRPVYNKHNCGGNLHHRSILKKTFGSFLIINRCAHLSSYRVHSRPSIFARKHSKMCLKTNWPEKTPQRLSELVARFLLVFHNCGLFVLHIPYLNKINQSYCKIFLFKPPNTNLRKPKLSFY